MTPSLFLYGLTHPLKSGNSNVVCAYCGNSYPDMLPSKDFFSERYTNWDMHKEKESSFICEPCAYILGEENFRQASVLADQNGIRFLKRKPGEGLEEIVDAIFYHPLQPPFMISLPKDYKKHIIMRSPVNYSTEEFIVQFGEESIPVIPSIHKELYETAQKLRSEGVSMQQIGKNMIPAKVAKKIGEELTSKARETIEPYIYSSILDLVINLTTA